MEVSGSEGGEMKKKPPEGENKTKRKMKTASQLEILEKTYAAESYPSESLRAELSVKLGLSDRQLQMWFCHRRLKDRKATPVQRQQRRDSPAGRGEEMAVGELGNEHASGSGSGQIPFGHGIESRRVVPRHWVAGSRTGAGGDMPVMMKRYYESQQTIAELRAIAFVEAQLGEQLREDGPILGMEFDTLPPDAFGAPIAMAGQRKQSGRSFDAKYDRSETKSIKGTGRALQEYQFIPEKPTVRTEAYERLAPPSYHYGSPADGPNARTSLLSTGHAYLHGNEYLSSGYGFQASEKRVTNEEDVLLIGRKRKSEEARVARDTEAHEKRIRKELEKQDILRRKREEQMRKEMERHDRERRKEEERLLREKQREEERYQREQRRELERREKFLQKESIRV